MVTGTYLIVLLQNDPPLRVAENRPLDAALLQLVDRDLTREGTVGPVEDVLGRNLNTLAEELASKEQVNGWRGDDHLCRKR